MGNVIAGTGSYLPEVIITNDDVARMKTDFDPARAGCSLDEWCRKRTGAITRHYISPGEGTSDMATVAAQRALDDAGLKASDIDLLVLSTFSGDYRIPQTAGLVQANLGLRGKFIQVDAACSGFIDALLVAHSMMNQMEYDHALVVGCEALSALIDPGDFKSVATFGDGAGAVVLSRHADSRYGIKSFSCGSDGEKGLMVWIPAGGTKQPLTPEAWAQGLHHMRFNFPGIYPYAVERMAHCTMQAVERAGITLDDVSWVVPHQASTNVIMDVAYRLEVPPEKFIIVFDHTGNTSSASIPTALDEANRAGKFADGDWIVMPAVGGGMAWGAACLVWYDYRAARNGANGTNGD